MFVVVWGEFTPALEDVSLLTLLPLFAEGNAMGIVLGEEDHVNVYYLMVEMTTSRSQWDLYNLDKVL